MHLDKQKLATENKKARSDREKTQRRERRS